MSSSSEIEKLRWINTEFKDRLDRQAASAASIDTKATTALGFAIALGAFTLIQEDLGYARLVVIGMIVVSCGSAALAMGVRKYLDAPEPTEAFMNLWLDNRVDERLALTAMIRLRSKAFVLNRSANTKKAVAWKVSAVTLCAAAAVIAGLLLCEGERMSNLNEQQGSAEPSEESPPPTLEDLMRVGLGTEEKSLRPDDVQYFEK